MDHIVIDLEDALRVHVHGSSRTVTGIVLGFAVSISLSKVPGIDASVTSRALNGRDCEGAVHENIP